MNTATEKNKTAKIAYICIMSFWFVVIIALVIASVIVSINIKNKISDVSEMIGEYSYFVSAEDKNMTLKLSAKENGKVEVTATRKVQKEDYELVPYYDYYYGYETHREYYKYFDYESEGPSTRSITVKPYFSKESLKIEYEVSIGLMRVDIENGKIAGISDRDYVFDENGEIAEDKDGRYLYEDYYYYPQTENKNA